MYLEKYRFSLVNTMQPLNGLSLFWKKLWNGFTFKQRRQLSITFLVIASCGVFVLALLQFQYYLNSPFFIFTQSSSSNDVVIDTNTALSEYSEAKSKDTDGDGLSDYDEEFVYGTSIYLDDTDGDKYSDKTEIESGNNALCPSGVDCLGSGVATTALDDDILNDPEAMKQALVLFGYDEDELDTLTDDQIRDLYVSFVSEENIQTQSELAQNIRTTLIADGTVSEELLNTLSDEELVELYSDILAPTQ